MKKLILGLILSILPVVAQATENFSYKCNVLQIKPYQSFAVELRPQESLESFNIGEYVATVWHWGGQMVGIFIKKDNSVPPRALRDLTVAT
jgi:hypothetical protein